MSWINLLHTNRGISGGGEGRLVYVRKGCEVKTVRYFDLFFILNRKQNKTGSIKDIVGK